VGNSEPGHFDLSRARVRCPLLGSDDACILYEYRPITCRLYGIPTSVRGKFHVCDKATFKDGESYPAFDMDAVHRVLYTLSWECLKMTGRGDMKAASLLVSVPQTILTPASKAMFPSR